MAYEKTNTWESLDFKALGDFLDTKTVECTVFYESHLDAATKAIKMTSEEVEEFQARQSELSEATKKWEVLREADGEFQKRVAEMQSRAKVTPPPTHSGNEGNENGQPDKRMVKSLGEWLTEDESYLKTVQLGHTGGQQYKINIVEADLSSSMKASTIGIGAGYEPAVTRGPVVVDFAVRRPVVADLIPQDTTTQSTIEYMRQTTFENAAGVVAESGTKQQSDVKWTKVQQPVQVIATYFVVTVQQLDDVPGFRALLDRQGTIMLQLAEEVELLQGNGTPPQLGGFYNTANVQTQATGADANQPQDAIYKAFTLVRHTGFAEPTGVVLNPDNWTPIRLAKTLNGEYLWGSPSEAGPERIWGKPVVVTTAATSGTGLTGDFQLYSHISRKMGVTIVIGYINAQLITNEQTVRVEERLSLEIYRPSAFCKITGLPTS
jgi:HK97 family phage major capsid protein